MGQAKSVEIDFEARLEKIKEIVEKLNSNDINLKDSIRLYQEAKEHIALANEALEQAEFELKDILQ